MKHYGVPHVRKIFHPIEVAVIPDVAPDQFDFAKPVTVVANGRTVFAAKVEKDLRTLLKFAAVDNDRTMLFGAEVRIDPARK